ncbi:MAG: hypothetical protein HONBIEJF_02932 [Fimbriimonadaceae bacterium]|nr:hypothetical protein [Fimbriimonadaceae bacterium]
MKGLWLGAVIVAVFGLGSAEIPKVLADHNAKLSKASWVEATLTVMPTGQPASEWVLRFEKPSRVWIDLPGRSLVSDGTKLTEFRAKDKTYSESALPSDSLTKVLDGAELWGFSALWAKTPFVDVLAAKKGKKRVIKGLNLMEWELGRKDGTPASLLVDEATGVARGYTLQDNGQNIIVLATELKLHDSPPPSSTFTFVPPAGATKVEASKSNATWAAVSAIFSRSCMPCHSAQRSQGGLNLASYESSMKGVIKGDPASSSIVSYITGRSQPRMPKDRSPLPEADIATIETWIKEGASKD